MRTVLAHRIAGTVGLAAALLLPRPAVAVTANKGVWDDGHSYTTCGTGVTSRKCVYDFWSSGCTEYAVAGTRLAGCAARVRAEITVVPIYQGTVIVGCKGSALVPGTAYFVSYDSTTTSFDNSRIDELFKVEVWDMFNDVSDSVVSFVAADVTEYEGSPIWVAKGGFPAPCMPGTHISYGGAGSVTVEV